MEREKNIIVAHPAQQHSYKTAIAIKEMNKLDKYVTTVYYKKNNFTYFLCKFLKNDLLIRAKSRHCEYLEDDEVMQFYELGGLFLLFLQRVDKRKVLYNKFNHFINKKFEKKVAKYVLKKKSYALVMYDLYAFHSFKELKRRNSNTIKILDMSAPYYKFMVDIFKQDSQRNNKYSDPLLVELNSKETSRTLEIAKMEIKLADFFLVASNFTKYSLLNNDIQDENIFKCIYGIKRKSKNYKEKIGPILECIFVGRITFQKGAHYLFKTIDLINNEKCHFTFVGNINEECSFYLDYKDKCTFTGHIPKSKMQFIYENSDILIFPSLADGFGFSVIEALASGVPVICSRNAGASDLIIDGYNGFLINPQSEFEILEKLQLLICDKKSLSQMKRNAIESAKNYSWDNYNNQVRTAFDSIKCKC